MDYIRVQGARTHNLKNISIDIPRHQLVVLTGSSGSGKSSLAFDTLYAEGQRRYVESISAYARQFLQLLDKPDVDVVEGLSPAIAIEQKATNHNPRSTVGTITEIADHLRLLFARAGTPYCPEHDVPLTMQSISQMVDITLKSFADEIVYILATLPESETQTLKEQCQTLQAQGFLRIRRNQEIIELDQFNPEADSSHEILEVVIDRMRAKPDNRQRLAESIETAIELSSNKVTLFHPDRSENLVFSHQFSCPACAFKIGELSPRMFSFNSPVGACSECSGIGEVEYFPKDKIVAFPELSLLGGALYGVDPRNAFYRQLLNSLAQHYHFSLDTPFQELPQAIQDILLHGSGTENISFTYISSQGKTSSENHPFEGVLPNLERRWQESSQSAVREELKKYRSLKPCPTCHGSRLGLVARQVFLGSPKKNIHEVTTLSLENCLQWFQALSLEGNRKEIGAHLLKEVIARLSFLNNVGLPYLALNRRADTLSGGESQRIRLASQIGSGLTGVMYVLDEPSIGLHQRDNMRLIETLKKLKQLGNTVIVVEHDEDMILAADYIIDMGPGAGELGGEIMASGSPAEILKSNHSPTAAFLNGKKTIFHPKERRTINKNTHFLSLEGCNGHNLQNVSVAIPLNRFVCITGVSGSGKSTLINGTLVKYLANTLYRAREEPAAYKQITGTEHINKMICVDQQAIGRTPRSNPATYTGLFTPIRELFASLPEAKARGYDVGRFSFNVKGGRCEACQGDGVLAVEMHFLPDVYVPCEVCHGKRYNKETLDIRYKGHNIHSVLEMTVDQATELFQSIPTIHKKLITLQEVGLGYIRLGQSAITLSGGEAQRIKLALELSKRDTGDTLYILDEPTTGLHFQDIDLLMRVLNQLVDAGNSVVVIEHNLDVIARADWIIDMGPEGGTRGGTVVCTGSPEEVALNHASYTGQFLKDYFAKKAIHTRKE